MIEAASKYGSARPAHGGRKLETPHVVSYNGSTRRRGSARPGGPSVLVPQAMGGAQLLREWMWRELKEGGFLEAYLRREKGPEMKRMVRRVGRLMAGFQQNNKSDLRRLASIPARLYHRWRQEDEHFWEDDSNLRSLKRDNPELAVFVGGRRMPSKAERKTYLATGPSRTGHTDGTDGKALMPGGQASCRPGNASAAAAGGRPGLEGPNQAGQVVRPKGHR